MGVGDPLIRMLQKHSKVATFEGSFESNTFVNALVLTSAIAMLEEKARKKKRGTRRERTKEKGEGVKESRQGRRK